MNTGLISMRYAKALLQIGLENKEAAKMLYDNSTLFYETLIELPEFEYFLKNKIIKNSQKKEIVRKVFSDKFHNFMMNFIEVIIDNKREKLINDIFIDFLTIYRKQFGIRNVKVITAIPVKEKYKDEISKILKERLKVEIELECKVDPEIIGGLIIAVDDKQADGSIAGELRALKKKMMN